MRSGTAGNWAFFAALFAVALALAVPAGAQDEGEAAAETAEEPGQAPADGAAETGPRAAGHGAEADGAAGPGTAEGEPADGAAGEDAASDDDGPLVVESEDGSVLDDQTYEGEDDDFIPSEEIPVDEPIPFPSDI